MNNNEQEMMLKKIEKRERFDTILAYILLVVLLICIIFVVLLKVNYKEEELEPPVSEYNPNYITLSEISSSLNNSSLVKGYISEGATFNSGVLDNSINVSYIKDDVNLKIDASVVGNELMIKFSNENNDIVTSIYKEIGNIICMFYGNDEKLCRYTLNNMDMSGIDGIRFDNNEDSNIVYITTTRSFKVAEKIVYKDITVVDVNEKNYVLELNDIRVENIDYIIGRDAFTITGSVSRLNDNKDNFSVMIKLYDDEDNLIGENKYEFNEGNSFETVGLFNIGFILSDNLKEENISKYSIEIVK